MWEKVNKPLLLIVVFNVFFGFLFFGLSRRAALNQPEITEQMRLGIVTADVDRSDLAPPAEEPLPMPEPQVPRKVEITLEPIFLPTDRKVEITTEPIYLPTEETEVPESRTSPPPVAPEQRNPEPVAPKVQIPLSPPSEEKYTPKPKPVVKSTPKPKPVVKSTPRPKKVVRKAKAKNKVRHIKKIVSSGTKYPYDSAGNPWRPVYRRPDGRTIVPEGVNASFGRYRY